MYSWVSVGPIFVAIDEPYIIILPWSEQRKIFLTKDQMHTSGIWFPCECQFYNTMGLGTLTTNLTSIYIYIIFAHNHSVSGKSKFAYRIEPMKKFCLIYIIIS